jgi:hypothetical protein
METQEEIDRRRRAHRDAMQQLREEREAAEAVRGDEEGAHQETIDLLARTQREIGEQVVENAALKKRIHVLEGQLEDARTWWTFDEEEVSRGWCVSPWGEEPSGFVAVFSDKAEAERYATWRQEQERAADEDERHQAWEFPNVLEAEFRVRFWNSFNPAPMHLQRRLGREDVLDVVCAMGLPHPGDEDLEEWADRVFGPIQDDDDAPGLMGPNTGRKLLRVLGQQRRARRRQEVAFSDPDHAQKPPKEAF